MQKFIEFQGKQIKPTANNFVSKGAKLLHFALV